MKCWGKTERRPSMVMDWEWAVRCETPLAGLYGLKREPAGLTREQAWAKAKKITLADGTKVAEYNEVLKLMHPQRRIVWPPMLCREVSGRCALTRQTRDLTPLGTGSAVCGNGVIPGFES